MCDYVVILFVFFFKQKTAYEMRISDWSSDVCSSDLGPIARLERSQPANAIVVGGQTYLIDAGDGLLRQMAASKLGLGSVKALFLTHHHIDHVADVPVLMIDRWLLANAPPLEKIGRAHV